MIKGTLALLRACVLWYPIKANVGSPTHRGGVRRRAFSWLQSETSPLDATKSNKLVLHLFGNSWMLSWEGDILVLCQLDEKQSKTLKMEYDFVPFCDRRCCLSHHYLCTFYESINRPLTSDCIKSATVSGPPHTISLLPSNKGALFIVTFLLSAERQGRKRQREREQFLCYFIGLPYSNHWVVVVFYFSCQWFNFQFHWLGWCCGVSAWNGSPCRVMEFSTRESNTVLSQSYSLFRTMDSYLGWDKKTLFFHSKVPTQFHYTALLLFLFLLYSSTLTCYYGDDAQN